MQRRWWWLALGCVVAVVVVGVVALLVAGGGSKRYEAEAFAFSYPSGWDVVEGVDFPLAEQYGRQGVGENTVGVDLENWLTVFVADAGARIDRGNVRDLLGVQTELVRDTVAANPGARVLMEPFLVEEAGLPGTRYRIATRGQRGQPVEDAITTLFDGTTSYVFNCQARPEQVIEMTAGCQQAFDSFEVGRGDG